MRWAPFYYFVCGPFKGTWLGQTASSQGHAGCVPHVPRVPNRARTDHTPAMQPATPKAGPGHCSPSPPSTWSAAPPPHSAALPCTHRPHRLLHTPAAIPLCLRCPLSRTLVAPPRIPCAPPPPSPSQPPSLFPVHPHRCPSHEARRPPHAPSLPSPTHPRCRAPHVALHATWRAHKNLVSNFNHRRIPSLSVMFHFPSPNLVIIR